MAALSSVNIMFVNSTVKSIIRSQRIGCISTEIARRLGISNTEALGLFYISRTSERFHDESTGLYLYGDLYIVDEFMIERKTVST